VQRWSKINKRLPESVPNFGAAPVQNRQVQIRKCGRRQYKTYFEQSQALKHF
jgi:hypothetical protein